jgi:colicin import membrane protein
VRLVSATVPDEETKLAEIAGDVAAVVVAARQIKVSTPQQAQDATAFLAEIKAEKTRAERARTFIVGPLNEQVRRINAKFKEAAEPLAEADQLVRRKVLRFHQEQERQLEREQARLDAQRRMEEKAAAAERQRAEKAARVAEREAEEAAARAREAAGADRAELETLTTADLAAIARGVAEAGRSPSPAERKIAASIVTERQAAKRAAEARREAEEATQRSIATQAAPALTVAPPPPLAAAAGSASVRQRWVATVEDETKVPREYLKIDMAKINLAVREGERSIPGVRIEQVAGLAVRAR